MIRSALVLSTSLAATALLSGCPAHRQCPNCEYRTATFSNADIGGADLTLDTSINHSEATSEDKNCPLEEDPKPCITDITAEDVTCRATQTSAGKAEVMLSVPSLQDANHKVTLHIKKGSTTKDVSGTVSTPSSARAPASCR